MRNCLTSGVEQLEQERANAAAIRLLFDEDLKVLVDDCHSQQDSRSTSNSAYTQPKHHYMDSTFASPASVLPLFKVGISP